LVGPSGSGKSTIVSLLLGLYKCNSGRITIDGMEIGELNKQSLRSLFALVSQDMFLFNDTVNANLSLDREYSEAKLWEALKVAYADDFVAQLPLKLNTVLGDRGTKLSGGQQQRLTIARAFLRQSEVLLFDEATSALDNESEKVVQKALDGLAGGHTVLAVAHRLTTIKNYDLIVVMQNGRVIEQGTHSELMSKGGEYARLWSLGESRQNSSYQVE
jgi:subfamily B ATP-binding cassette protein MsbA